MTILDRARGRRQIQFDVGQLADDLAKRVPDLERVDLARARDMAAEAVQDASERARHSLDRASERAREMRADLVEAIESGQPEQTLEDVGQKVREVASPGGIRAFAARIERELPDTDKDRYDRAYERGRIRARTIYLGLGLAAGIAAGIAAALLLEPRHGRERREALSRTVSGIKGRVSDQVGDRSGGSRASADEGPGPVAVMDVAATELPTASGPIPEAGTDPEAHAHEALPEPPAAATEPPAVGDPTDPVARS